jgi:hypothetical protein
VGVDCKEEASSPAVVIDEMRREVSSESGVTKVGVAEPGRKNPSIPSPIDDESPLPSSSISSVGGRTQGRVGARVLGFLGRALPRCFSC